MSVVTTPFQLGYTSNVPELLTQMKCSLAISTYQAGKVIFLSPQNGEKLVQLPRSFLKPMGIALDGDKMAIACKEEVLVLRDSKGLAKYYPNKPETYDGLFMPRTTYHTGALDVHDIDFCEQGLCAVNTNFSCIIKIDDQYSFTPIWKPNFISKITSGDRCHLNGMGVENHKINCVSAFAATDQSRQWKENITTSGILIDFESKEIIASDLGMPHSPRILNGEIYLLLSATGELIRIDKSSGKYDVVTQIDGFVRGLSFAHGYAFIGISKIRKSSSGFSNLPIAKKANQSGIVIVHLATGAKVGQIIYKSSVDELYDVQVLPDMIRPSIMNTIKEDYKMGLSIPETTFWGKKKTD